ncbi:MAG: hypothetical protein ACPGZU_01080 [Ketobacter sp.]|jgi:uncharacterized protein (DUF342 family)|uniref:YbgF trimerisation domain-containing protein n=1 Tax=Ketobacter alkanivorans TaxID=1917421 RepID=A0A2K9LFT4_9GAMM|nr:hypothetical protein Kalk_01040 [Ketobacter alkanivorans]MAR91835.1 hypothetical protein [Pseudomonadales bacterium]HAG95939.1 hypothetical protein [Gammaproteobacteria bacterium]MAR93423.1 hypothetical protein [Pseudomonadales bacterium]HAU14394.1 hypothetical protein [Gammaproteobacteria bacterium]|tara:strand:- start:41584 stop:41949 length:366 start_codon:yes stop_codon:yes gene_type:complete
MLKKSMSFHAFTLAGMLFIPTLASSHSAHDPIKDIQEYNRDVRQRQSDFQTATNPEEQLKNLQFQVETIERKLLVLRNLMASDYPHIKEKMSKYKYDYMESVDDTIVQLKNTLEQAEVLLD